MVKKYLPLIILLLIAIPVGLFYFFFRNVESKDQRDISFEAVPENAVLLLENQSAADFMNTLNSIQRIKENISLIEELAPIIEGLNKIDTLLQQGSSIGAKLKNVPVFVSVHQTGDDQYDYFIVLRSAGKLGMSEVENLLEKLVGKKGKQNSRNYVRTKITRINFGEGERDILISELKDYILISPSEPLLEGSIRQIRDGISLQDQSDFSKVALSAGQNVHGNMFINLSRFPEYIGRALNGGIPRNANDRKYGSWLELDLTLRPDALLLNGFASSGDTTAWLDIFKHQEPQKIELDKILPANCMSFFAFGINDATKYREDLDGYLANTQVYRKRQADMSELQGITGGDAISECLSFINREAGLAYLPGLDAGVEAAVVIGTQSQNMAFEVLSGWLSKLASKEGKSINDYRHTYRIDQERQHYIYDMPVPKLPEILFGPLFDEVKGKYFSFSGNYLIIADSRQAIQDIIYFKELNKTLSTDPTFQSTVESIVSRSNFYFYSAPFRSASLYTEKLNSFWDKWITKNEEFLQKMGAFSLQIQSQPRSELYFHNLIVKFADNSPDRPETVWESRLETTLNFKPALVTNHSTRGKEIFIQDEANKLYLVNSSGRILWNLPMDEAIRSEVFQIDYYKNGKLQYLFSTDNSLHLLDREGNYVDKYPIRLRSTATNGMALFDYDKSRDYRIFIAGSDKKVYLYDKTGSQVKGWEFDTTEGVVNQPVIYQRIGTKDYIIFSDEMRVYILDRRGEVRVNPEKQFARSANNNLLYEGPRGGHGARMVGTDVEGSVYYLYFDGKVESRQIKEFGPDHYFEYQDLDKDGNRDFIFLEENRLEVFGSNGEELFSRKMDARITHPPAIYRFPGNEKKIGVVTRTREEIYLINSDGSLYDGFPLRGRTMFSIGYLTNSNNEFNLLVGGDNLFLYNYRVK